MAASPFWNIAFAGPAIRQLKLSDYPFQLGVASGDPSPDGFVLWTRLAPDPATGGGMPSQDVQVDWQVASDENMSRVIHQGSATASPQLAHSVHVEIDGLEPDRWYWYQFKAGSEVSPRGRTRTAPPAQQMPSRLRFAFASCQHFEQGLFTAYEHMAREDLDLVIHLGDYIYEGAGIDGRVRKHDGGELYTLENYRNRYAQYKADKNLQEAHAAFPWIVTWDDHEVDNNYANDISEQPNVTPERFLKRRADAYQAYYEHMPLRRRSLPSGPNLPLYRRLSFGRLAQFSVLDTRQYRTDQPCGEGRKPPCDEVYDPQATLLGAEQEEWLRNGLLQSNARWNVLAQQVMMARVDRQPGEEIRYQMDQWPGYEANRRRVLQFLGDNRIANPVVLTGDIHSNWVNDLKVNFDEPDGPTVATELVGTSISSGADGAQTRSDTEQVLAENPFVKFYNSERGYVRCEVTPEEWRADYRVVEYVSRPGAPSLTRASFLLEDGRPGARKL